MDRRWLLYETVWLCWICGAWRYRKPDDLCVFCEGNAWSRKDNVRKVSYVPPKL